MYVRTCDQMDKVGTVEFLMDYRILDCTKLAFV